LLCTRSFPLSYRLFAVASAAVLALQGCAVPPTQPKVAIDALDDGIAKTCTFTPIQPTAGATVESKITMTNDGWCGYRASVKSGQAYELGLVKQRPAHGELQIRKWNGETRAEYTPAASYVGPDQFSVALRPADGADALVKVAVTVTRGEGVPAVAAPAPSSEPATTPTRRRTPAKKSTH
jgi:hypothetical protein